MKKTKLSKRLQRLADCLNGEFIIADIGTDHGYLPYYLLDSKRISHAILCDINKGPLMNAQNAYTDEVFKAQTEFRLGSGIEPLNNGEVDVVIIAGMGGGLIQNILDYDFTKTLSMKAYILQPQTEQDLLRKWLLDHEFSIIHDYYIFDDRKYYEVITALPPNSKIFTSFQGDALEPFIMTPEDKYIQEIVDDLEFGYCVHQSTLKEYMDYLKFKRNKYVFIKDRLKESETQSLKALECIQKISSIDRIMESLSNLI